MIATGAGGDALPINVINIGDPMSTATSPNPALDNVQVLPRFESFKANIEHMVVEVVKEQLNRRQGADNITRNFIKFLTSTCGLLEVRHLVVPKLEMWIMNHKISRPAQELLMAVAMNCNTHSQQDVEVINGFNKFRFKNKPNVNLYLAVSQISFIRVFFCVNVLNFNFQCFFFPVHSRIMQCSQGKYANFVETYSFQ